MNGKTKMGVTVGILAAVMVVCLIFMFNSRQKNDVATMQKGQESTQKMKDGKFEYMDKLFNKDKVDDINIQMDKGSWDEMLKNASEDEKYYSADITINGQTFKNIGIKPKGSYSLSAISSTDKTNRFSFKIKTDEFVTGQKIFGISKFVLNNNLGDATSMKEYLSYDMLASLGVPTPGFAYGDIKLNGESWGMYLVVQSLDKNFMERSFGNKNGNLYKIEDVPVPEGEVQEYGSSLRYKDDNPESYPNIFKNAVLKKTTVEDNKRVVNAIKNLNAGTDLDKYFDVDEVLKYFAVNTYIVNLDSYACINKHNYFLYEENGKVDVIPWDYNVSFGGFAIASAGDLINFPIDKPIILDTMENSPLIAKLIEVPEYKEKYHNYLKQIVETYSGNGKFQDRVSKIDSMIADHVKNDSTAFYTYDEYKKGIENLKIYGEDRDKSVLAQLDGSQSSEEYGNIETSLDLCALGDQSDLNLGTPGNRGELDNVDMRAVQYIGLGQLLGALTPEEVAEGYEKLNLSQEQVDAIAKAMGLE